MKAFLSFVLALVFLSASVSAEAPSFSPKESAKLQLGDESTLLQPSIEQPHTVYFQSNTAICGQPAPASKSPNSALGTNFATHSFAKSSCLVKSSHFDKWVNKTNARLNQKSFTVDTPLGLIQYAWHGEGPVIVAIHGGFGGWDQGLAIADFFVKKGFSILSVSRPGYLGTPLPQNLVGEYTPAQQADLIAALLDALGIPQAIALGFSAGGPVAFELAKRHPDKITALILESLGREPTDSFSYATLAGILSQPTQLDFYSYLLYMSTHVDLYSAAKILLAQDTTLASNGVNNRIHFVVGHASQFKMFRRFLMTSMPLSSRLAGLQNDFLGANYWEGGAFDPTGFATPTVIVQSVDDNNGYLAGAQAVSTQLPGSLFLTVQGTGHFLWFGPYWKDWQNQVNDFLDAHLPQGSFKPDKA